FTQASETVEIEIVSVADAQEAAEVEASPAPGDAPELDDWDAPTGRIVLPSPRGAPSQPLAHSRAWGELLVTAQAASCRLAKRYTHETLGYGQIDLPPRQFQTTGYWLWLPPSSVSRLSAEGILVGPNNYGPNWETQRNAARARDSFRCVQCGQPEAREGGRQ